MASGHIQNAVFSFELEQFSQTSRQRKTTRVERLAQQ